MNNRDKRFYDWAYFEKAASLFRGMDRIHLTGGEPTMHPDFHVFAESFKNLFKCNRLTIETNGFLFDRNPYPFIYFDEIYFSHYREGMFEGCEENIDKLHYLEKFLYSCKLSRYPKIIVGEIQHVDRSLRPGTKICERGTSEGVAYIDGKIYPCCIGSGLDKKIYLDHPGADWREKILDVHPPCYDCFFALPN